MKDPERIEIPKRSESLGSWCLPMMAKSLAADEKEREALALLNAVKNLSAKQMQTKKDR